MDHSSACRVPSQFVLYANDAVDVSYSDGSKLQLSACGSTFQFTPAPSDDRHPLREEKIQQRSQFVTSAYKESLLAALDFRNRFCQHPYLCKDFNSDQDSVLLHADLQKVAWPPEGDTACIHKLPDGSMRLESVDGYAMATLAPHRQNFTVQYWAKISQPRTSSRSSTKANSEEDLSLMKWKYVRTTQYFSIYDCPEFWQHPLLLLQEYSKTKCSHNRNVAFHSNIEENESKTNRVLPDKAIVGEPTDPELTQYTMNSSSTSMTSHTPAPPPRELAFPSLDRVSDTTNCVQTSVPESLPLSCQAQHLHRWDRNQRGTSEKYNLSADQGELACLHGNVKVVCMEGIIYRLIRGSKSLVEVYPGDGSVLRSHGLTGHFFNHYLIENGQMEEKMYSVKDPPRNTKIRPYSIERVLTRAARFLEHICVDSLQLLSANQDEECCWKAGLKKSITPNSASLLEQCEIDGLGKFSAYSSGRVRAVFCDRTCLDLYADFSPRLGASMEMHKYSLNDLPEGICRLLLPNGHYQLVPVISPGKYERYISAATEWVAWVNCKTDERNVFYKKVVQEPETKISVESELKKINCFNYIMDNAVMPQLPSGQTKPPLETSQINTSSIEHSSTNHLPFSHYHSSTIDSSQRDYSTDTYGSYQTLPSTGSSGGVGGAYCMAMVQQVLSQTSAALQDLDDYLAANGEVKPVKDGHM